MQALDLIEHKLALSLLEKEPWVILEKADLIVDGIKDTTIDSELSAFGMAYLPFFIFFDFYKKNSHESFCHKPIHDWMGLWASEHYKLSDNSLHYGMVNVLRQRLSLTAALPVIATIIGKQRIQDYREDF